MDIYRDEILDHYKHPRNQGKLKKPDVEIEDSNSSCGDKIKLQLKFDSSEHLVGVKHLCQGCAISTALSSMLTELIKDKSIEEMRKLSSRDIEKLMGGPISSGRVKCAQLSLKALQKGLKKYIEER